MRATFLAILLSAATAARGESTLRLVEDIDPGPDGSMPQCFIEWDGLVWFQAYHVTECTAEVHLYATDGTKQGTREVALLGTDGNDDGFSDPFVVGDKIFFLGRNDKTPRWRRIWRTDGTEPGTWPLTSTEFNICPQTLPVVMDGRVLAFTHGAYAGHGLISIDPATGAVQVLGAPFDMWEDGAELPVKLNGAVILPDMNCEHLWRVDAKGLKSEKLMLPGLPALTGSDGTQQLVALPGAIAILPNANESPFDVWRKDGTTVGTLKVGSLPWKEREAVQTEFFTLGKVVLLLVADGKHGCSILRTDGTAQGTQVILDLQPYKDATKPKPRMNWTSPMVAGGVLYFVADDGTHGCELWCSDGSKEGTRMAVDLTPGTAGTYVLVLTPTDDGRVLLTRHFDDGKNELWVSDGTPQGTVLLIEKGRLSVDHIFVSKGRVFLSADDDSETIGKELWLLDLPAKPGR